MHAFFSFKSRPGDRQLLKSGRGLRSGAVISGLNLHAAALPLLLLEGTIGEQATKCHQKTDTDLSIFGGPGDVLEANRQP